MAKVSRLIQVASSGRLIWWPIADWWIGDYKEHKWFERGVKEAIYVRHEEPSLNIGGGLRHNLSRAYDGRQSGKYQDGFLVTSLPIHQSAIGHQISWPDDAAWIGCDTVAINHSKSRRFELFLVFVICTIYLSHTVAITPLCWNLKHINIHWQFSDISSSNEFARNIFHTKIMHPKPFTQWCKYLNFFEKNVEIRQWIMKWTFQWTEDLSCLWNSQAISRTTGPNIGYFVLNLMHFSCWLQWTQYWVLLFFLCFFLKIFQKNESINCTEGLRITIALIWSSGIIRYWYCF